MSDAPEDLRAAVERNAEALMTGNFNQIMADITPEALAQIMQAAPQAGGMSLAQMPAISGYEIEDMGATEDGHVFNVTFVSTQGRATLSSTWKQILGQWKIAGGALVSVEPEGGTA